MHISGSTAIVTGGASGLGEAICRRLIELGATAIAFDVDAERGERLHNELGDAFGCLAVDVSDTLAIEAAVSQVTERFGDIGIAVNAAAIPAPARLVGKSGPLPMDVFDRGIKINLYGPVNVMRSVAAAMVRNEPDADGERGILVNVSSGAAWEGQIGQVAYSASKAALVGMTLPLARELGAYGIRVMTLAPGAFETPIYAQVPDAVRDGLIADSVFPARMGRPAEFALLVEEVIRNAMHNGRTLRLDGGLTLRSR
ncbi:SDR family NAD(P)-dependent oxidoreductase [Gordonia sp. TBRC 11910]|uniref:SDR family NAD(P)-dependent oxidoreductase n=1 Tax=Gordonia asplenii TaxID=2725283 RepID=A0A848L9K4_9ACTN|nr:SDR family NAD(P)-dependent oxidoreductase [Gordonia asplenii]NMO05141.1 SDR family NAD(P)-dependent oxidoreductase [Gordonia asplenii]